MPGKTPLTLVTALVAGLLAVAPSAARASSQPPSPCADVVEGFAGAGTVGAALAANADTSVFAAAVEAAGLTGALDTDGPVTVLAPANSAFEAIPANVLDSIFADPELLATIVRYHVVPGAGGPDDLAEAGSVTSLLGAELTFNDDGDGVLVNGVATICGAAELETGTILVIDAVLQPPADGPAAPGSSVPGSSVPGPDSEQQAVALAFETAVDSSLSYDEQAPFIEDAEALRETIESYPAAAAVVMGITAEVTSVAIDGDTAAIAYVLAFNGVDAGYGELDGTMVRIDGHWVVPRDEYCAFQAQAFNNCPS